MVIKESFLRDFSFFFYVRVFVCVWGGGRCNFPAELVSKTFLPPCSIHLKCCPLEDEGYSVVSSIAKHSWGRCKPPRGLEQSPGGGLGDEAPKPYGNLVFDSNKTTAQEAPPSYIYIHYNAFLMCTIKTSPVFIITSPLPKNQEPQLEKL